MVSFHLRRLHGRIPMLLPRRVADRWVVGCRSWRRVAGATDSLETDAIMSQALFSTDLFGENAIRFSNESNRLMDSFGGFGSSHEILALASRICFPWIPEHSNEIAMMIWNASPTGELYHVFWIRDKMKERDLFGLFALMISIAGVHAFITSKPPLACAILCDAFDPCI